MFLSYILQKGYLNKYGYMDTPTRSTTTTTFDSVDGPVADVPDGMRSALMKFQVMAGLPQTGELDEATEEMMAMPRCGVSDHVVSSSKGRSKRFALTGNDLIWIKYIIGFLNAFLSHPLISIHSPNFYIEVNALSLIVFMRFYCLLQIFHNNGN